MTSPLSAAKAYASLAKIADPSAAGAALGQTAGSGEKSFGSMVKDAMAAVVESGKKSDAQTQAMASGKANVVDVVTAVAETEVAIDALVAVRDRVIQSYEEIMRMPI